LRYSPFSPEKTI